MTPWSRRQALAALASSALAPLAGSLLSCAAPNRARRGPDETGLGNFDAAAAEARARIRALRDLVPGASIDLARQATARSTVDATGRTLEVALLEGAVLSATNADGRRIEIATGDTTRTGLRAAAELLAEQARASGFDVSAGGDGGALEPAEERILHEGEIADARPSVVADIADRLFSRSRNAGGSRIVYRGSHVELEDARRVHVGPSGERRYRVVRGLAEVLLIASAGTRSYADRVRVSALGPPQSIENADGNNDGDGDPRAALHDANRNLDIDRDAVEVAADNALALLMSRPLSARNTQLLLAPDVAALLASDAVARRFTDNSGSSAMATGDLIGSPLVTLVDRPGDREYGAIAFDDRGAAAADSTLVDRGRAGSAPATLRRASPTAPARPDITNLLWQPAGDRTGRELLADIDDGLVLEGALDAVFDSADDRITLRAARGREVRGGQLSGRLFGPIVARASLRALLGAVDAVSGGARVFPAHRDGVPVSVAAPFVRTRSEVTGG